MQTTTPNVSAKQQVLAILDRLPGDCTIEDIQYHLYVIQKLNAGLQDLDENGGISQEEAKQRLAKWLTK